MELDADLDACDLIPNCVCPGSGSNPTPVPSPTPSGCDMLFLYNCTNAFATCENIVRCERLCALCVCVCAYILNAENTFH